MRRAAHEGFNIRAVEKYQSIQHDTVVIAMLRTLANPSTWETNLATYVVISTRDVLKEKYNRTHR